jgi:MoxR-like ATPase
MKVTVDYPEDEAERDIIRLVRSEELGSETSSELVTPKHIEPELVIEARRQLPNITVSDLVENYIVALVMATRKPERYADSQLQKWIEIGSSPRASISLDKCARAYAWLQGRDYVTPDDVRAMVPSVLGHRFSLSYDALADGVDHQRVVQELLDCVEIG